MNHPASNVLLILSQNAAARPRFGKNRAKLGANSIHAAPFSADEDVFKSIDTSCFCA
jgi:hypothetical protein